MDGERQEEAEKRLREEGFAEVYTWTDGPNTYYGEHKHETKTAHIIIDGRMEITMDGETNIFHTGDRIDIPSNTVHTAKMGPKGCTYVIGES